MRIPPLALAAGLLAGAGAVRGQPVDAPLEPSTALLPLPRGAAAAQLPTLLQARSLRIQPDIETNAEGDVEFRRGGLVIRADGLSYDNAQDLASAQGHVRVSRDGAVYSGPEMQLHVQRFEGFFLQPEFEFTQLGAGGRADRVDFIDAERSRATRAEYTSCPRDGPGEPDWVLRTDSLRIDLGTDQGVAEGAVLRFMDTPILALPSLSFPLSDARLSGWLPPTFDTDSRSGIELAVPYYWNIAPNRDATITPRIITRRGLALNTEVRYLEPELQGVTQISWLPSDRLTGRARESLQLTHDGHFGDAWRYDADIVQVSDDDWWKDFPGTLRGFTARLLSQHAGIERPWAWSGGDGLAYARVQRWQALQGSDTTIVAPYARSPQLGARLLGQRSGWSYSVETEYNHFALPGGEAARAGRSGGDRWHLLGSVSRPWREPGWFVVPRLDLNAALYGGAGTPPADAARRWRAIPSLSLDSGLELERQTAAFGRALRQTLEPRLLYVLTPYRTQSAYPEYDAAAKDFNFASIYTANQFSGVDRVNDANQLTAGLTTRYVDASSGAEMLRLGIAQRYLFRPQRVTAQADGTPDGAPISQRFSDVLLLASTSLVPRWTLDSSLQYSPDSHQAVRALVGARYSPGPFHTLSATYRLTRGLSEQLELGWQWPLWSGEPAAARSKGAPAGGSCRGTWYAVGRVNYSMLDSRVTDSVIGTEYDAGCWIARIVAERLSTGTSTATTRLMLQLELVGLSRLGSNPLKVLKDNIPGYRLLRDERGAASPEDRTAALYD